MGRTKEAEEEAEEEEMEGLGVQGHYADDKGRQHHHHHHHHHHSPPPPLHIRTRRGASQGRMWSVSLLRLWVCCLWVLLATPVNTCADSNGCDFYGSGLKQDGRGIQPVYLACTSGRVEWQYPRAGLRVILKSPNKGKEFRACIKGDKKFEGARLYLEGHRSLLPVFHADDGRPKELVRCFSSYKGEAALYVEAEQGGDGLKKRVAAFDYHLTSVDENAVYEKMEECRPCTDPELLHLFCAGDFVARGSMLAVMDKPNLEQTAITIQAAKIFQQTYPVFGPVHANPKRGSSDKQTQTKEEEEEEEDYNDVSYSSLVSSAGSIGRVFLPLHCGARWGEGEFLIIGEMRLGQPILRCAPRYEEWVTLVRRAQSQAQCILES